MNHVYNHFNSNLLVTPISLAISVPKNEQEIVNQEKALRQQLKEFWNLVETKNEAEIHQNMESFITYYFTTVIPYIMKDYEQNKDPSVDISNSKDYLKVEEFFTQVKSTITRLEGQLSDNADKLAEKQLFLQNVLIICLILSLILFVFMIQRLFRSIGKPLAEFTFSVNEIAAGRDAEIHVDSNRKDELGTLSVAFQKMVQSIHDNEQDLITHNEELLAQQEDLHAKQLELQSALKIVKVNERNLMQRNALINGISSSLDKEEVLQSIVESMCHITRSDKGIISFLDDDTISSYGISGSGVEQFKRHLSSGVVLRLTSEKKAFTVKREQHQMEKGYHETLQYSYDLYLPVVSSSEVKAILVFTRYGEPFSESELTEYDTLTRQISIYLEKLNCLNSLRMTDG